MPAITDNPQEVSKNDLDIIEPKWEDIPIMDPVERKFIMAERRLNFNLQQLNKFLSTKENPLDVDKMKEFVRTML